MLRFRSMNTLQKFSSVHAQVHNHFNLERHLVTREVYNLIEQDHRGVKQRIATMLGFTTAAITIAGIELMHRIR